MKEREKKQDKHYTFTRGPDREIYLSEFQCAGTDDPGFRSLYRKGQ